MIFTGKVPSVFDETTFGDSFGRSSLFKIQSYTYVQGTFEGADFDDYYRLDLSAGDYVLYFSTLGLNAQQVLNSSFKIEIVDEFGSVVIREDATHPDAFTDQISFSYTGVGDFYLKATAFTTIDFAYEAAVYLVPPIVVPPIPSPDQWVLIASDGQVAGGGGRGTVFGTSAFQQIGVYDIPGIVAFDPSFNKGGDVIALPGQAADWMAFRSGSNVTLWDGDTFVQIPVGLEKIQLSFEDGTRYLRIDANAQEIKLGTTSISTSYSAITGAPDAEANVVTGMDYDAVGRLILAENAASFSSGNLSIFGTAGEEIVAHVTSYMGNLELDPSFNKGGDTLLLSEPAQVFEATINGSSVKLDWVYGDFDVIIPVGREGMNISFAGDIRTLVYDTEIGKVTLGTDILDVTPLQLSIG